MTYVFLLFMLLTTTASAGISFFQKVDKAMLNRQSIEALKEDIKDMRREINEYEINGECKAAFAVVEFHLKLFLTHAKTGNEDYLAELKIMDTALNNFWHLRKSRKLPMLLAF